MKRDSAGRVSANWSRQQKAEPQLSYHESLVFWVVYFNFLFRGAGGNLFGIGTLNSLNHLKLKSIPLPTARADF